MPILPALIAALAGSTLKADALMMRRGSKNMEEAAALYETALAEQPDNLDLALKTADAWVRTRSSSVGQPRDFSLAPPPSAHVRMVSCV